MSNDDKPMQSIEDAMKEYETVNDNPNTNNIETTELNNTEVNNVQENVQSIETPVTPVQPQAKYHVNGKDYNSLTEMMNEQDREKLEKAKNNQANPNNPINNNQNDYLRYFIGNNYESYVKGGISFAYFFFGENYLMYRKIYGPAIIKFLITVVLETLALYSYVNENNQVVTFCFIGILLIQLLPIFIVKSFYLNYANGRVKKILEENKGKSEQELINICSSKGGTSFLSIVIFIVIYIIISSLFRFIPFLSVSSNESDTYEIKIRDLRTLSTNYLGMVKGELHNQSVIIENECVVKINTKYMEDGTEVNNLELGLEKNINNHMWLRSFDGKTDKMYTANGDYLYIIELTDYKTNEKCKESIDILVNNLKFD